MGVVQIKGLPFLALPGCLKGLYPAINGVLVLRIGVLVACKVAGRVSNASGTTPDASFHATPKLNLTSVQCPLPSLNLLLFFLNLPQRHDSSHIECLKASQPIRTPLRLSCPVHRPSLSTLATGLGKNHYVLNISFIFMCCMA
jgi:hypothetical protein